MTTTVLFTDLADSTSQVASGDTGVTALMAHLRACRAIVERNEGRVTKTMGDGVMAKFESAHRAVCAAIELQQRTGIGTTGERRLRVGLHVGEPIPDPDGADDLFGATVVIARRLCDMAAPGTIVTSDLVRQLLYNRVDLVFEGPASRDLKGLHDPVLTWTVQWEPLPERAPRRVIVADDVALVRTGVVRLLADAGYDVVADVADHDALLAAARQHLPHLVVTDIRMPPDHTDEGIRAATTLRAEQPDIAVMVLSQHIEPNAAALLLDGAPTAVGYLLKERVADLDAFVAACDVVSEGGCVIDSMVTERLVAASKERGEIETLTAAERDVLELMAQGRSNSAIAEDLICSVKTVESHAGSIFSKLGLESSRDENRRVSAVVRWLACQP